MANTPDVTKEILGLEKQYWKAMQQHDLSMAVGLTDFPCVIASAHGLQSVNRTQFEKMFNSREQDSVREVEVDSNGAQVRLLNSDTAVIAYQVKTKFTHGGEEKNINAIDTSTWIKRDGKWVCAMHTEIEMLPQ